VVYEPTNPEALEADYRVLDDGQIVRRKQRSKLRRIAAPLLPILLFVATKLKFVFGALKALPFLSTGFTAILSVGAYALAFGWQIAIGLVVLLFIHEMGHVLVLRRYGVKATAPVFIPFLGAFIGMKQLPHNAVMEAYVGLGGPVIGSLGAMAAWGLFRATGHEAFLVAAFLGVFLNLFNLLPILPLDGGRAVSAISRWLWLVGLVGLVGLMIVWHSPLLFLLVFFMANESWHALRRGKQNAEYYAVPRSERLWISAIYFGLIVVLAISFHELQTLMIEYRP
jgi:Zn-dependent protease